jgi:D-serine deaminase-like pyridoxal phosphate-dependent protein
MMTDKVSYASIDTPAILVNLDKLEANISEMAQLAKQAGIGLVPHSKCHKSPYICRLQTAEGAKGISVSKMSEAEVLVDEGLKDIEVVHPIIGEHKFNTFRKLFSIPDVTLKATVDMMEQAEGLSQIGQALNRKVPVLLKINTGLNRFGVLPGKPALEMAKKLANLPGIELIGILAHESCFGERTAEGVERLTFEHTAVVAKTATMLQNEGINIKTVAIGATPSAKIICRSMKYFPEITEVHPGAYVLGDLMYTNAFAMTEDRCAATVLTTVLNTTCPGRASIDAGAKTLGVDALGQISWKPDYLFEGRPSYGSVRGRPDIRVEALHEEIGILRLTDPKNGVHIGDRLEILPNHVSFAVALHDTMYGVRNGRVEMEIPILLRCKDY